MLQKITVKVAPCTPLATPLFVAAASGRSGQFLTESCLDDVTFLCERVGLGRKVLHRIPSDSMKQAASYWSFVFLYSNFPGLGDRFLC